MPSLCKSGLAEVRDKLDYTPLHYAALYGSTDAVRLLLEAGADPNARNKTEPTPLIYGAWNLERTRLLAEHHGDVNAKSRNGSTALSVALAVPGNEATVRYLIEKGAVVKPAAPDGHDYLMRAAAHQDTPVIRLLLDRGLDPHTADSDGDTALLNAFITCDGGAKARLLIAAGADVNAANTFAGRVKNGPIEATGETPLMSAAACGETSVVADLLKAGAKIDTTDKVRHMTALMRAIAIDRANPETVSLLVSSGANLDVADRNSETALDWARKFRNPAIVAVLEKAGAKQKGLPEAPVKPSDYKPTPREAVDRASALLATSSEAFFREGGGCVGAITSPSPDALMRRSKIRGSPPSLACAGF